MATPDRFIVAEVSKGWIDGQEVQPTGPISRQFEEIINVNWERGYRLVTFQLSQNSLPATVLKVTQGDILEPAQMMETIVAVFERV